MQLSNLREHFYKVSQFKVVDMLRLRQGKTDAKFREKIYFNFLILFQFSEIFRPKNEKDAFQNFVQRISNKIIFYGRLDYLTNISIQFSIHCKVDIWIFF